MSKLIKILLLLIILSHYCFSISLSSLKFEKTSFNQKHVVEVRVKGTNILSNNIFDSLLVKANTPYVEEFLRKDMKYLLSLGYFKSVDYKLNQRGRWVSVTYTVVENNRIESVDIIGITKFDKQTLVDGLKTKIGEPYNYKFIDEDRKWLESLYHQLGYNLMILESMQLKDKSTLVIKVNEGYVDGVRFLGVSKVKPIILKRELSLYKGQVFNSNLLQKDRRKFLQMGYFSSVSLPKLSQKKDDNNVILTYNLKERAFNFFNLGLEQLPDDQGFAAFFKVYYNHLLIHSDQVSIKTQLQYLNDFKLRSYSIQYKQPWLVNRFDVEGNISFFQEFYKEPLFGQSSAIESKRTGVKTSLTKAFFVDQLEVSAMFKYVDIEPTNSLFVPYNIRSLSMISLYDNRKENFDLNTGQYIETKFEKGGRIGSLNLGGLIFQKWQLTGASFFEVTPRTTLALKTSVGVYKKSDSIQTFDSEAFYLGGANTVRGYPELAFVGNKRLLLNIEYRLRVARDVHTILFFDIGNVFERQFQYNLKDYHKGVGLGFRYVTGIAPLRLDFAYGKEFMIHLGLGQLF